MSTTSSHSTDLSERISGLAEVIESQLHAAEQDCQLSPEIYSALAERDLFALLTPSAFGGIEADMVDVLGLVRDISAIDGATGWNLNQSLAMASVMPWFPEAAPSVFDDPNVVLAGALWPPATATRAEGGYSVSGRMPFVSGSKYARWVLGPAVVVVDNQPVLDADSGAPDFLGLLYSIDDLEVLSNWNPSGMRGTGSNDAIISEVFVPETRVARVIGAGRRPRPEQFGNPMYALAPWTGVLLHAAVPLGIGQALLDDTLNLVPGKVPNYFEVALADRPVVQQQLAEARAALEAGFAYLIWAVEQAIDVVANGDGLTDSHRVSLQLAACHAADQAAKTFDLVSDIAGTSTIKSGTPMERRLRDGRTILRHVVLQRGRYESAAKAMLGQPTDWFPFWV